MWEFLEDEVRELRVGFDRVEVVDQLEKNKQFLWFDGLNVRQWWIEK